MAKKLVIFGQHTFLVPFQIIDPIRLGNSKDGGYLVSCSSITDADVVISFGLGSNITFERDALKLNPRLIVQIYDHTVKVPKARMLLKIFCASLVFWNFALVLDALSFYVTYKRKQLNHYKKKVVGNSQNPLEVDIPQVFGELQGKRIFLKVDIERDEYNILFQILEVKKQLKGLVIEFHDSSSHIHNIQKFIENLSPELELVHFHGNNFSELNTLGIPEVFELSFARFKDSDLKKRTEKLPNPIYDAPNAPNRADFEFEHELNSKFR